MACCLSGLTALDGETALGVTEGTHCSWSVEQNQNNFNTFQCYSQYLLIIGRKEGRKEGNVLFNDEFNTFYLWLYGIRHMVKDQSAREEGRNLMFYLTMHSTHFIYSYMASDIW